MRRDGCQKEFGGLDRACSNGLSFLCYSMWTERPSEPSSLPEFGPVQGILDAGSVMGGLSFHFGSIPVSPRAGDRFAENHLLQNL